MLVTVTAWNLTTYSLSATYILKALKVYKFINEMMLHYGTDFGGRRESSAPSVSSMVPSPLESLGV